ncbi:hypothetical protein ONZ45_g8951 [Pleurotus djamor]|nr:hypothetical protein ONZ45_g8951 [Pleurotus djamor]
MNAETGVKFEDALEKRKQGLLVHKGSYNFFGGEGREFGKDDFWRRINDGFALITRWIDDNRIVARRPSTTHKRSRLYPANQTC